MATGRSQDIARMEEHNNSVMLSRYLNSIEDKDAIQPGYDPDKAFDDWWQRCQDFYDKY